MKPIILGIFASAFFGITFVLNRLMELSGGSWVWSASLRYFFTLPFFLIIVYLRGNLAELFSVMKGHLSWWILWSTVGFGLFYTPLCYAATYGPSWLIAGMWQVTIVAGTLMIPLIYRGQKIPRKSVLYSMVILFGILIMQKVQFDTLSLQEILIGSFPVLVGAIAYPLGNRKMILLCAGKLDTYQRILGMTLASMPFWLLLSLYGLFATALPSLGQIEQSFNVAVSSGVIATTLFFMATDIAKNHPHQLAAVEATQAGEIIFSLLGDMLFLGGALPSTSGFTGMMLVIVGMILHSRPSKTVEEGSS
ncbi:multidrug resistance efflux transporter family protein [Heliobacterium chlorum]|uniref:Multidrug resistance efflux transporter family protein n=1 Tax=Heliobacterium chlorum TaxID=2698 RepID=A0ABR7SZA8_HELCL|nr:multidrug resistance efflux transporter family protein [Heliobacterium chlorum]MBC9783068.1 multidrug resistance efflux transporter family protein [Heliobacterium chlorum]